MNKDQIFAEAIKKCTKKTIDRDFIAQIVVEDKTNTIKRDLNSFGITQLALQLQELAYKTCGRRLEIQINDFYDPKQNKRRRPPKIGFNKEKFVSDGGTVYYIPNNNGWGTPVSYTFSHAVKSTANISAYPLPVTPNIEGKYNVVAVSNEEIMHELEEFVCSECGYVECECEFDPGEI